MNAPQFKNKTEAEKNLILIKEKENSQILDISQYRKSFEDKSTHSKLNHAGHNLHTKAKKSIYTKTDE
jgi:hypothetical protein